MRTPNMNAQVQTLELSLEGNQVEEAVASIFHTVLLYRTRGKFKFQEDHCERSEGTVGFCDVDCDFIDLTYVRCSSASLDHSVKQQLASFSEALGRSDCCGSGEISLKFYRKTKAVWPFPSKTVPWEVWNVQLDLIEPRDDNEGLEEVLKEKIISIAEFMNNNQFTPDTPSQQDLCLVFDLTYNDCLPYLHDVVNNTSNSKTTFFSSALWNMFW